MKKVLITGLMLLPLLAFGQTVTVKDTVYTTYPFSDPDPVPHDSHIYPYYKFEKFSHQSVQQTWKTVILENDYLRVRILPGCGGKIWSIYDKKQGKELFYDNDAIKFRDISLRGPWTSGGIEFNFGVIGHAPSCSFPVDYCTATKEDGSVSCWIGVLDLLTRTRWTVEINLPKDKTWVTTKTFWHNASGDFQPYYTWINTGVKATPDTRILYPAAYAIGHDGKTFSFPIEEGTGRDLSWLNQQGYGMDKSYHAGGSGKGWFASWWKDEDFGMMHWALRDDKVGRKYFSWAQSDAGDIWRELLTDNKPQYIELQSGRLFNQNLIDSYKTPYKQFLFTPYGTDDYLEYWFPFAGIGAAQEANLRAVSSVETSAGNACVSIYPLKNLSGRLELCGAEGVLAAENVSLQTAVAWSKNFPGAAQVEKVTLDGQEVWNKDEKKLARPDVINGQFDENSLPGNVTIAQYYIGMRYYDKAAWHVKKALEMDPANVAALDLSAMIALHAADWQKAWDETSKALAVDTYDPQANYLRGQAAVQLGRWNDAFDSFEIAAITPELRGAACTRLSALYLQKGEKELAAGYADKALVCNSNNLSALVLKYLATSDEACLAKIESLDPLCHFPAFLRYTEGKLGAEALAASIQEELRWQEYMETALFLNSLGERQKAAAILAACPEQNILTAVWTAWLNDDASALANAFAQPMEQVFAFRTESIEPLEWAWKQTSDWKAAYLLSALYNHLGRKAEAQELVKSLTDINYAPFYAYRSSLAYSEADLLQAVKLDPSQWRYVRSIAFGRMNEGRHKDAAAILASYYAKHKDNFYIGEVYAKALIACQEWKKAEKVMTDIRILPYEGQAASHVMYRDIKLHLAAAAADAGNNKLALQKVAESRLWPHNLGVGKPYDDLIDNKAEDWIEAVVLARSGKQAEAQALLQKLPADGAWKDNYDAALVKKGGKYAKISPMLGNMDANFDKRLF